MTVDINNVHVFKTNISSDADVLKVKPLLDSIPNINAWSIDVEDIDCVLRIVAADIIKEKIINDINQLGFDCSELE